MKNKYKGYDIEVSKLPGQIGEFVLLVCKNEDVYLHQNYPACFTKNQVISIGYSYVEAIC